MPSTKSKRKLRFHTDDIRVHDIDYSRNGVSGDGFWSLVFEDLGAREKLERGLFVANVFDDSGKCAVLKLDRLKKGEVKYNNWRGDFYETALRKAIEEEKVNRGWSSTKWPEFKGRGENSIEGDVKCSHPRLTLKDGKSVCVVCDKEFTTEEKRLWKIRKLNEEG